MRAGTRIRMLTVGAVLEAPVIGSRPGVFVTTTSAAPAIDVGDVTI